ncbi:MAG: hypothetical protein LBU57_05865, partial [Dysgonamonadaceae bacterium]|nr:hypothetical protein [Dysgonamonadaceae bacterium]
MSTDNNLHLYQGIAVIIDDQIGSEPDGIDNLILQIETGKIPCLKLKELPDTDIIEHLHGISFILLDWKLTPNETQCENGISDVTLPTSLLDSSIDFLKKVQEKMLVPIFIFTNEDETSVESKLTESELLRPHSPNSIFIKSKEDLLTKGKLFDEINNWATNNPPMYVLKTWEHEYRQAQGNLFADFYKYNPSWVTVLKECHKDDGVNIAAELMTTIRDNLFS